MKPRRSFGQARDTSKELSGADPQVIDGLGYSAYWTGGNLKQMNLLKGDAWLIITASTGNGTDPLEASKSVSRKILARMTQTTSRRFGAEGGNRALAIG